MFAPRARRRRKPDASPSPKFSPCGRHAATASGDNTVHVWDLCEKTLKLTLGSVPENLTGGGVGTGHRHIVTCVCFSADSMFVASGSYDKTLSIWSVEDGSTLAIMSGHAENGARTK